MNIYSLLLITTNVCAPYICDSYAICGGKDSKKECLEYVNRCLVKERKNGTENDIAFEWCAEKVPPALVVGIVNL
jgi:hypothetical protein